MSQSDAPVGFRSCQVQATLQSGARQLQAGPDRGHRGIGEQARPTQDHGIAQGALVSGEP